MATKNVPGLPVAIIAVGGILAWSGLFNQSLTAVLGSLLTGKAPTPGPQEQIAVTDSLVGPNVSTPTNSTAAANQATAQQLATAMGHADWTTGQQWSDWVALWNQESGWSATAKNPSSGAFGIPQALPASKMASAGSDYMTNPATQIKWGITYIAQTYGSPSAAEAHEKADGWY